MVKVNPGVNIREYTRIFLSGITSNFPYLLRMMAADTVQSQALVSVVERLGWTRMAILTSNTDYGKQFKSF